MSSLTIEDIEAFNTVLRIGRPLQVGDTTIRLRTVPENINGTEIVVDVFGDNPELRTVTAHENRDITVAALSYAHAINTVILRSTSEKILPRLFTFTVSGTLEATTHGLRLYNNFGRDLTIDLVQAFVDTAPTGATLIVDVNIDGTTMFTAQDNRPTIAISGNASTTTAPDVTTLADGEYLQIDVDQVGSSEAGQDLTVIVRAK
jgi:hypothetical protein